MRTIVVGRRRAPAEPPDTGTSTRTDRRYHTNRWRIVRLRVLKRDGYQCRIVEGCPTPAKVADHIVPVYAGMSDSLFFSERNLRAGCRAHNFGRGLDAIDAPVADAAPTAVVTGDYS